MAFGQYVNLDFDQIKTSIRDYLRANTNFTDYDFEGSNLSIIIDALAYNTYTTAYNTNMAANECFLDSATLRENVVSLARNIGYVPRSRRSARARISFTVDGLVDTSTLIPLILGSKFLKADVIASLIPIVLKAVLSSKIEELISDPKSDIYGFSPTIVKIMFLTDLFIASSSRIVNTSFVTG